MAEIPTSEDSVYFKSWGQVTEKPVITYTSAASVDSESIGKLPAHQWVLPGGGDWDHLEGLLEVQEIFEGVPPADWGQKDAVEISRKTKFN